MEEDIESLVEAKKKPWQEHQQAKTKAKKENEEKKKQTQQKELNQQRDKVITEIIQALNQEPKLTSSDLTSPYQNWETQINQLTDLPLITNLQDRILADIQAHRQGKISTQKVRENLNKVKTGTKEEQQQAWKDLENQETEKGYQDNQAEVENLKKQKAAQDPQQYSQEVHQRIENKLNQNQVKIEDLTTENQQSLQKLKEGQITDPTQLVETENNLKHNIYQVETAKKVANFTTRVNHLLKLKSKSQIDTLKKELLAFISSSNIYYVAKKKGVEQLLEKLENYNENNNEQDNKMTMSTKIFIGIVIPLMIVGLGIIMIVRKRRKKIN